MNPQCLKFFLEDARKTSEQKNLLNQFDREAKDLISLIQSNSNSSVLIGTLVSEVQSDTLTFKEKFELIEKNYKSINVISSSKKREEIDKKELKRLYSAIALNNISNLKARKYLDKTRFKSVIDIQRKNWSLFHKTSDNNKTANYTKTRKDIDNALMNSVCDAYLFPNETTINHRFYQYLVQHLKLRPSSGEIGIPSNIAKKIKNYKNIQEESSTLADQILLLQEVYRMLKSENPKVIFVGDRDGLIETLQQTAVDIVKSKISEASEEPAQFPHLLYNLAYNTRLLQDRCNDKIKSGKSRWLKALEEIKKSYETVSTLPYRENSAVPLQSINTI